MTDHLATAVAALEAEVLEAPPAEVPAVAGELERLRAMCWARLVTPGNGDVTPGTSDRLLTAREVHTRTTLSIDYIYRHADTLPFFARRAGRKVLFSEARLARWMETRRPH